MNDNAIRALKLQQDDLHVLVRDYNDWNEKEKLETERPVPEQDHIRIMGYRHNALVARDQIVKLTEAMAAVAKTLP